MEYNVLYLVKALLKKWYVILLAMIVVCVAAVGLSKISYKKAVADYQQNLAIAQSENKKVTLTTGYTYQLDDASLSALAEYVLQSSGTILNKDQQLLAAKSTFNTKLAATLNDKTVLAEVAEKYQLSEEDLGKYLEVGATDKDAFYVTVNDLSKEQASEMRDCYLSALQKKLSNVFLTFKIEQGEEQTVVTDEAAAFINAVMEEPSAPSLTRTVMTAALYAFAFACIGVLVFIFVKENKQRNAQAEKNEEKACDCSAQ